MGEQTGISWTDSTINVWHGCDKVSQGCKYCYAEVSTPVRVKTSRGLKLWGKDAARDETKGWAKALTKWNREAVASGKVHRVFGQSLSDTFEDRRDLDMLRERFFMAIEAAPALTFQLLTKRPEHIREMVPESWMASWPAHVQIGCTVEDQENAERRIPHLLAVPAPVRFLSVEPQIGPVDLDPFLCWVGNDQDEERTGIPPQMSISWVICGGESGSKARPFDLAWARQTREQCRVAGVPWFCKQLGARPIDHKMLPLIGKTGDEMAYRFADSHGGDESEWPADLRGCRAFP